MWGIASRKPSTKPDALAKARPDLVQKRLVHPDNGVGIRIRSLSAYALSGAGRAAAQATPHEPRAQDALSGLVRIVTGKPQGAGWNESTGLLAFQGLWYIVDMELGHATKLGLLAWTLICPLSSERYAPRLVGFLSLGSLLCHVSNQGRREKAAAKCEADLKKRLQAAKHVEIGEHLAPECVETTPTPLKPPSSR